MTRNLIIISLLITEIALIYQYAQLRTIIMNHSRAIGHLCGTESELVEYSNAFRDDASAKFYKDCVGYATGDKR